MADVGKMFFQVKIKKEDQNFLCFFCWPEGGLTQEPQEYCITVHLFETGLSPGCYYCIITIITIIIIIVFFLFFNYFVTEKPC